MIYSFICRPIYYPFDFISCLCFYSTFTDRQTDILLTEIKVITDLFVIVIKEIYVGLHTRMLVY